MFVYARACFYYFYRYFRSIYSVEICRSDQFKIIATSFHLPPPFSNHEQAVRGVGGGVWKSLQSVFSYRRTNYQDYIAFQMWLILFSQSLLLLLEEIALFFL